MEITGFDISASDRGPAPAPRAGGPFGLVADRVEDVGAGPGAEPGPGKKKTVWEHS